MKAPIFLKIVTAVNVIVATGFSVAGIINPAAILPANIGPDKAIATFALYATARTIPLAAIAIALVIGKRRDALFTLALLAGVIQLFDGFIGIYQHDASKSAGPFLIAVVQFIGLYFAMKGGEQVTEK
ncbi:hypothetical protein [Mucilaginibacter dorajii]|uniref:DoxX family protein n=1 Tax=Mucilaginibacter dorajii TaxID=692994 RepID=A0ABP7QAK2_9SPHI|nr:hypothetical protein [Mucilaginibacter dorajii]MCS3737130.1 hypothetical protein [Mucilaginibacter dorajii]